VRLFISPRGHAWPFGSDSNITKYYCQNYFLTFKCYCFHHDVRVAAPLFIFEYLTRMTERKRERREREEREKEREKERERVLIPF